MKLLTLNVCGLTRKLKYQEFRECIIKYDILILSELKTDDTDLDEIREKLGALDFKVYVKNRFKLSTHRSGGVAICIKSKYDSMVRNVDSKCKYVHWLHLDKKLLNTEKNVLLGAIYIPPQGTQYSTIDSFDEIQGDLIDINANEKCDVILAGDFNSYTSTSIDYISIDTDNDITPDLEDLQPTTLNGENELDMIGVQKIRCSLDKHKVNNYGARLLELCQVNSVFICNGRLGADKEIGALTCNRGSIVDYFICSPKIISKIHEFEVMEFDDMLSDVHCAIHTSIITA